MGDKRGPEMLKSILEGGKLVDEGSLEHKCLHREVRVKSQLVHSLGPLKSSGIRDGKFLWRQQRGFKQDDCWKSCRKQSFSTLALLTFGAREFFVWGLSPIIVRVAASLASTH